MKSLIRSLLPPILYHAITKEPRRVTDEVAEQARATYPQPSWVQNPAKGTDQERRDRVQWMKTAGLTICKDANGELYLTATDGRRYLEAQWLHRNATCGRE